MTAKGNTLTCASCGAKVVQNKLGGLVGGKFDKVTQWYKWQRECVAQEIANASFVLQDQFVAEKLVGKKFVDCGLCSITCDNNSLRVAGTNIQEVYKRGTFYTLSFDNEFLYLPTQDAVFRFRRLKNFGITTKFNLAIEEQSHADELSSATCQC